MKQKKPLLRLDRILANNGYCTRSGAREFLKIHTVVSDGRQQLDPSAKVTAASVVIDDLALEFPDGMLIALNKPEGYVCSHESGEGPLVYELLPEQWMCRNPKPSTIGRLDKDATGLILITDLTYLMHDLTSPKKHVDKTYQVTLGSPMPPDLEKTFAAGTLMLKGEHEPCSPATLARISDTEAVVTLSEGRYHQVKRMFAEFGCLVTRLHRTSFGPYSVEGIEEGRHKEVSLPDEIES